ncbi:hypothetical protein K458DRAFT_424385 [Lentithecium fluviatile CBS 122367]|uniref:LYR motif-containing protein Cup1-like N-terminal domain-containing protein n=1 Tax=Lentithecium fluviatile CBS 122367 TaxID=1168545 RepID=A0A6G1IF87_9PLEO|nr:hypothetical protein K458DRAFT_424385 [Lentithecium fluviatile CBS 122367]
MPPALQQTAWQLKSVRLLRALLREASYLPDANARDFFRRYIVNRFRAYQPRRNATGTTDAKAVEKYRHRSFRRREDGIIIERTRAMQRKGQLGLNYLRRAAMGEAPCLQKILLFTYGRMGRRKYSLLEDLLRPDEPEEGPAPLQKLYYSNQRFLSFFDAPKPKGSNFIIDISDRYSRLKAVVRSQSQKGIGLGKDIKRPHLQTPIHNIWQRPMPIKRARNNVKRWYAETMTRLLPPLPNEEWDSLQAMIDGTKWISFVKRRTPALELHPCPTDDDDQFTLFLHKALTLEKPSKADRPAGSDRPHTINTRFMRRLYSKILVYCCKLEWNEERSTWVVVWGRGLSRINNRLYSAPTDDSLFAGVNDEGKLIREPPPDRQPSEKTEKKPKRKHVLIPFYVDYLPKTHPLRVEADVFWKTQRDAQSARPAVGGEPN